MVTIIKNQSLFYIDSIITETINKKRDNFPEVHIAAYKNRTINNFKSLTALFSYIFFSARLPTSQMKRYPLSAEQNPVD